MISWVSHRFRHDNKPLQRFAAIQTDCFALRCSTAPWNVSAKTLRDIAFGMGVSQRWLQDQLVVTWMIFNRKCKQPVAGQGPCDIGEGTVEITDIDKDIRGNDEIGAFGQACRVR